MKNDGQKCRKILDCHRRNGWHLYLQRIFQYFAAHIMRYLINENNKKIETFAATSHRMQECT